MAASPGFKWRLNFLFLLYAQILSLDFYCLSLNTGEMAPLLVNVPVVGKKLPTKDDEKKKST